MLTLDHCTVRSRANIRDAKAKLSSNLPHANKQQPKATSEETDVMRGCTNQDAVHADLLSFQRNK